MIVSILSSVHVHDTQYHIQSHSEWTARMVREGKKVGRRQRTTGYQKATHFELGSDEQR